jgi:hypothetical protein
MRKVYAKTTRYLVIVKFIVALLRNVFLYLDGVIFFYFNKLLIEIS